MINKYSVGKYLVLDHVKYARAEVLKEIYDQVVSTFEMVGYPPNRLSVTAAGAPKNYGDFKVRKRWLDKHGWENIECLEMCHLLRPEGFEVSEWSVHFTMSRRTMDIGLGWLPDTITVSTNPLHRLADYLIKSLSPRYGYRYSQEMRFGPLWYAVGIGYGDASRRERSVDFSMNVSHWRYNTSPASKESRADEIYESGLLRDIYTDNYLREQHLRAPVGRSGLDLRRWIEADPAARGALEPITDEITAWRPPTERIPMIREELFRNGRVFYWKFFLPTRRRQDLAGERWVNWDDPANQEPEPFYRADLFEPWESPEPIPEIYRASFYKDKDPGLIY